MRAYPLVEHPAKVAGVPIRELGLLLSLMIGLLVLGLLASLFLPIPGWYYVGCFALGFVMLIALRRANRSGRPHMIASRLSWLLHQPKKLDMDQADEMPLLDKPRQKERSGKPRYFSEVLPLLGIEQGLMYLTDGRLALGFALEGPEAGRWNKEQFLAFQRQLTALQAQGPAGLIIQKVDAWHKETFHEKEAPGGFASHEQARYFSGRPVKRLRSMLFLSLGPLDKLPQSPLQRNYGGLGKAIKPPFSKLDLQARSLRRVAKLFRSQMKALGLSLTPMDEDALWKAWQRWFNLDFQNASGFERSLTPLPQGLALGEKLVSVISLNGLGTEISPTGKAFGMDAAFTSPLGQSLEADHVVVCSICLDEQESALEKLDGERRLSRALSWAGAQEASLREESLEDFSGLARREQQRIVRMSFSVIVSASEQKALDEAVDESLQAMRSLHGCRPLVENSEATALFLACAPGNAGQQARWLRMLSPQASVFFGLGGPYHQASHGLLLCDRHGSPCRLPLPHPKTHNKNGMIMGPSGSGKSVFVATMMLHHHEAGSLQLLIDNGGSHSHLMQFLGARYFAYDPDDPVPLNPFWVNPDTEGGYAPDVDKLTFLMALLAKIWKNGSLSPSEQAILSELIPAYYASVSRPEIPSLPGFARWLAAYDKAHRRDEKHQSRRTRFDFDELCEVLEPFVSGVHKALFKASDPIDLSGESMVCFDIQHIKDNPMLYPIITLIITELALSQFKRFPDRRKLLYLEEVWSMLQGSSLGPFIEQMYRTARKQKGSIYIITQGIDELLKAEAGPAILQNSSNLVLLAQNDEDKLNKAATALGLSPHETDMLRSLRSLDTRRELFIKLDSEAQIYGLELPPSLRLLVSSTPDERNRLAWLIERYEGRIEPALFHYLEEYSNPHSL